MRVSARLSECTTRPTKRISPPAPRRSARTTTVVGTHDTTRGSTGAIWHAPRLACPVSASGPNGSHAASLIFRRPKCQVVFCASHAEHAANQHKLRASTCAAARVSPSAQHDQPSVSATPMRTHRGGRHARPLRSAHTTLLAAQPAHSSLGLGPRVSSVPTFNTGGTQHDRAFVPPEVRSAHPSANTLPPHTGVGQRVPHRRALLGIRSTTTRGSTGAIWHAPRLAGGGAPSVPTVLTEATQQA